MGGDVTLQAIKRLTYDPDHHNTGNIIGGQNYNDVYFTGGQIANVILTNCPGAGGTVNQSIRPIEFVFNNGGSVLTSAMPAITIMVPQNCVINSSTVIINATGSITLAITRTPYSTYPSGSASIVASAPPTISSGQKAQDTTLSGWTTAINQYDIVTASIASVTGSPTLAILMLTGKAS